MKTIRKTLLVLTSVLFVFAAAIFAVACGGNEVRLKFETNGGTAVEEMVVEKGSAQTAPVTSRDGFAFDGWYANEDFSGEALGESFTAPDADTTYYAKWEEAYLLTLDPGEGTLATTSLYLKKDAVISEAIKDYVPTAGGDLYFGAWFEGKTELSATRKMPASPLTLTARYKVPYTVEAYVGDLAGETYSFDEERTATAGDYVGAELTLPAPEFDGLIVNTSETGTVATRTLGKTASENVFRFYYDRLTFNIIYNYNNLPDASVTGSIPSASAKFGATVSLADGTELSANGYRFAGWASSANGALEYGAGASLVMERNYTFYAVWDKAKTDAFGGADELYLSSAEENTVYLRREGLPEEQKGSFDPATREFVFTSGENVVLRGRIAGDFFYYFFNDIVGTSYSSADGASITFLADGKASFRENADAAAVAGKYDIDPVGAYYLFESDDGATSFAFALQEADSGVIFVRQNLEELGFYAVDANHRPVIYLDGFGGLIYYYTDGGSDYYDLDDYPITELRGLYAANSSFGEGFYEGAVYLEGQTVFEFVFHMVGGTASVEGFDIKGRIERDDGYLGQFIAISAGADGSTVQDYVVFDGFGEAEYSVNGYLGTYEVQEGFYYTDGSDVYSTDAVIRLQYRQANTDYVRYFQVEEEDGERFLVQIGSPINLSLSNTPEGRFDFTGLTLDGESYDGFVFLTGSGAQIYIVYATQQGINLYAWFFEGSVSLTDNFDEYLYTDADTGAQFYFTAENGKLNVIAGAPIYVTVDAEKNLRVETTQNKAYLGDSEIPFTCSRGYIDYYTFTTPEGELSYYVELGTPNVFHAVAKEEMLDLNEDINYNNATARLLLAGDDRAFIGLLLRGNGGYLFVGEGTVAPCEDGDHEYAFELILVMQGMDSYLSEYSEFRYKVTAREGDTGLFTQKTTVYNYTNFKSDGYSLVTYTPASGAKVEGFVTFDLSVMIEFYATNGTRYLFRVDYTDGSDESSIAVTDITSLPGVGYYYALSGSSISTSSMLLLFGNGEAVLAEGGGAVVVHYEAENQDVSGLNEYRFSATAGDTAVVFYARLFGYRQESDYGSTTIPLFEIASDTNRLFAEIVDAEDHVVGQIDAYGYATFQSVYTENDVPVQGTLYLVDLHDDSYLESEIGFDLNANGKVAIFVDAARTREFVFDREADTLVRRTVIYGAYAESDRGVRSGSYLYLDGHGHASYYDGEGALLSEGDYALVEGYANTYYYRPSSGNGANDFLFGLFTNGVYNEFRRFDEEENATYYSDETWEVLILDGYGRATYIDRYGLVYSGGNEDISGRTFGRFYEMTSGELTYEILYELEGNGIFHTVDNSAHYAVLYNEKFETIAFGDTTLLLNGEYAYYRAGSDGKAEYFIYNAESRTYTRGTIDFPVNGSLSYLGVNYYEWSGELTFTDTTYQDANGGNPLTLTFTPSASSLFSATFCGRSGYYIALGYEDEGNTFKTYLLYQTSSSYEVYDLALTFTGTASGNTFKAQPNGMKNDYTEEGHDGELHINYYYIGHLDIVNDVTASFPYIDDEEGNPLRLRGAAETLVIDGDLCSLIFTGGDGNGYTVWFSFPDGDDEGTLFLLECITRNETYEQTESIYADTTYLVTLQRVYYAHDETYRKGEIWAVEVSSEDNPYVGYVGDVYVDPEGEYIVWSYQYYDYYYGQAVSYLLIDLQKTDDEITGVTIREVNGSYAADENLYYVFSVLIDYSAGSPQIMKIYRFGIASGYYVYFDDTAVIRQGTLMTSYTVSSIYGEFEATIGLQQAGTDEYGQMIYTVVVSIREPAAEEAETYTEVEGDKTLSIALQGIGGTVSGTIALESDLIQSLTLENAAFRAIGASDVEIDGIYGSYLFEASTVSDGKTYIVRFSLDLESKKYCLESVAVRFEQSLDITGSRILTVDQLLYSRSGAAEYAISDLAYYAVSGGVRTAINPYEISIQKDYVIFGYEDTLTGYLNGVAFTFTYDESGLITGARASNEYWLEATDLDDSGRFSFDILIDENLNLCYLVAVYDADDTLYADAQFEYQGGVWYMTLGEERFTVEIDLTFYGYGVIFATVTPVE